MAQIPIVVISGFLGAGKTTLLNRIVREGLKDARLAIVVNDFGKLNIDADLIESGKADKIELSNGCVCCALASTLLSGLNQLAKSDAYDKVILESSGVTRLSALLHVLQDDSIKQNFRVQKTITVVDSRRYELMKEKFEAVNDQIEHANILIQNRIDSVDTKSSEKCRNLLSFANPNARIIPASFCQVDIEGLLLDEQFEPVDAHSHSHDHWQSCLVKGSEGVSLEEIRLFVQKLPKAVMRAKGFWKVGSKIFEIQRVGLDLDMRELDNAQVSEEKLNQIVLIGNEKFDAAVLGSIELMPGLSLESESVDRG